MFISSSVRFLPLPPVVRESLIRFRHAVDVVSLLDGAAAQVRSVVQFVRQLSAMPFSGRVRAFVMIQRIASEVRRFCGTSIGTW